MKRGSFLISLVLSTATISVYAQTGKVLLDNDKIRITQYISKPGEDVCGAGSHSHGDHATVLLTDATVKTIEADKSIAIETYLADKHLYTVMKNGKTFRIDTNGTFWVKGTTHSVTNTGKKILKCYIIETK